MGSSEDKREGNNVGVNEESDDARVDWEEYFESLENGSNVSVNPYDYEDYREHGPIEYIRGSFPPSEYDNKTNSKQNGNENKKTITESSEFSKPSFLAKINNPENSSRDKENKREKMGGYILLGAILSGLSVLLFLKLYDRFPDSFYYWYPWKKYSTSIDPNHYFFMELYETYGVNVFLIIQFCITFAISLMIGYADEDNNLGRFILINICVIAVVFIVNTIIYLIAGILCGLLPLFFLIYGFGAITASGGSLIYLFVSVFGDSAEIRIS